MSGSVLFSSLLPAVLTIVIVLAGVIGTIFPVNNWVKGGIIGLMVLAGIGTFLQFYESNRDTEFLKGALSTMLASMPETPGFDEAMFNAAFSVAKQRGYSIPITAHMDEKNTIFFLSPEGTDQNTIGAVLPINLSLRGDLYVSYVSGSDLRPIFEQAIFGTDATGNATSEKILETYLDDLHTICTYVLSQELERRKAGGAAIKSSADFKTMAIRCASENPNLQLSLDGNFIKKIKPMAHGERNAQALSQLNNEASKLGAK
jgi:hypothetical protein